MLQKSTVDRATLGLLIELQQIPLLANLRLVGGTALALQIGHRRSIDLDLFGHIDANYEFIEDELSYHYTDLTGYSAASSIHLFRINNVKVDIVCYPYEWIAPAIYTENIILASMEDIAAMKLKTIANRGSKKDFVDIYFLLQHFSLEKMSEFYLKKYPKGFCMGFYAV